MGRRNGKEMGEEGVAENCEKDSEREGEAKRKGGKERWRFELGTWIAYSPPRRLEDARRVVRK